MASRKLQNDTWRELKRITESIPRELLDSLMKKENLSPTIKHLFNKALTDKEVSATLTDEQRERFKLILESGVLDKQVDVLDFDTEKAIDAYLQAEIELSIRAGRLPKEAPQWAKLLKKGKKYAKRQNNRLKELFDPGENTEGDAE